MSNKLIRPCLKLQWLPLPKRKDPSSLKGLKAFSLPTPSTLAFAMFSETAPLPPVLQAQRAPFHSLGMPSSCQLLLCSWLTLIKDHPHTSTVTSFSGLSRELRPVELNTTGSWWAQPVPKLTFKLEKTLPLRSTAMSKTPKCSQEQHDSSIHLKMQQNQFKSVKCWGWNPVKSNETCMGH